MPASIPIEEPSAATSRFDLNAWLSADLRVAFQAALQRRRYKPGQIIFLQNDAGDEMFRLIAGAVRLSVMRDDGRELLFLLFGLGDCFGESSMVDGEPRIHTAEALNEVVVDVLSRAAFDRLRREHASFNDALLRLLAAHMRLLSGYYADAALDQLPNRLAGRLLANATRDKDGRMMVRLAQAELGRLIGTSRQTVNKILKVFENEGLVRRAYGAVYLEDREALRIRSVIE